MNPIFRREFMFLRKNARMAIVVTSCNVMLWVYAVFQLWLIRQRVGNNNAIQNTAFIRLFHSIALVEFFMVMAFVPISAALSITSDREKKTLDLILTSLVTPKEVILGKLMSSIFILGLTCFSTLPTLSVCFMYGGIMAIDFFTVFLVFLVSGFLFSGIGIYASSHTKDSFAAILMTFAFVIGLYIVTMWLFVAGQPMGYDGFVLFVYNPVYTMLMYVNSIGGGQTYGEWTKFVNSFSSHIVWNPFFLLGLLMQILTGSFFLLLSVSKLKSK